MVAMIVAVEEYVVDHDDDLQAWVPTTGANSAEAEDKETEEQIKLAQGRENKKGGSERIGGGKGRGTARELNMAVG